MYITNRPEIAQIAESAGVDRIFVDMEYIGKEKRQNGLDPVMSRHSFEDIKKIANSVFSSEVNSSAKYLFRQFSIYTVLFYQRTIISINTPKKYR